MLAIPKHREVQMYVAFSGVDDALPPDASELARDALAKMGEGQLSPLWAIQPVAAGARGPVDIALEWRFAPDRTIGVLIRVDGDRSCRVIEGGIGFDPSRIQTMDDVEGDVVVSVGAIATYEIEYGPRSILRWLANIVEPRTPPEPKTPPPRGGGDEGGGIDPILDIMGNLGSVTPEMWRRAENG